MSTSVCVKSERSADRENSNGRKAAAAVLIMAAAALISVSFIPQAAYSASAEQSDTAWRTPMCAGR